MNGQAIILTIHLKPCNVAVSQLVSNAILSTCQSQFLLGFSAWQVLILDPKHIVLRTADSVTDWYQCPSALADTYKLIQQS